MGRRAKPGVRAFEVSGPGLVVLLRHQGQFAQVVDVAEGMAAGGLRQSQLLVVVHAHAAIARQIATDVGRRASAFGLDRKVGKVRGAGGIHLRCTASL